MSPLSVKILLHIYAHVRDYRDEVLPGEHARSEGVRQTFERFESEGLVEQVVDDGPWCMTPSDQRVSQYRITPKGEAMVDAICAVQIPICKWVQPEVIQ